MFPRSGGSATKRPGRSKPVAWSSSCIEAYGTTLPTLESCVCTTGVAAIQASKGTAATEWLGAVGAEFVLAIGDDRTDEDLFRALPATAYSVRVGLAQTAARYYLNNHTAVRRLLRELIEEPGAREGRAANGGSKPAGGVKKNGEAPASSSKVAAKGAGKTTLAGLLGGLTSEAVNWVI